MSYIKVFKTDKTLLGYGFINSFFSAYGQTFLIAAFVPYFMSTYKMSNSQWGSFYSLATLLSAILFPFLGRLPDSHSARFVTWVSSIGIALACLLCGATTLLPVLFIAMILLRLFGQAMLSHIASVYPAKYFSEFRGRALSLSSLGHPLSEALLPPLIVLSIYQFNEDITFIIMGTSALMILLPISLFLINKSPSLNSQKRVESQTKSTSFITQLNLLKSFPFILIVFSGVIPAFVLTGIFIHQVNLSLQLGLGSGTIAFYFFLFASGRTFMTFAAGKFIDRFTAKKIYPYYLLPLGLACISLFYWNSNYGMGVFLLLAGLGIGHGTTLKSALWPELFGTKNLGSIRSIFSVFTVLATSISPFLFGLLLDTAYPIKSLSFFVLSTMGLGLISAYYGIKNIKSE
jgi:MFS family permease